MYDVQLCTYVVHARYIPVTSDLRMRNRHVEVAYSRGYGGLMFAVIQR